MEEFKSDEQRVYEEECAPGVDVVHETMEESVDQGRRRFLKGMLGATALVAVGGQPLKELFEEEVIPEQLEKELAEYREALKEEYGIELDFNKLALSEGSSRELSLSEQRDFAEDTLGATRRYPKNYVEKAGLHLVNGVKWYEDKNSKDPLAVTNGYFKSSNHDQIVISKEHPITYVTEKFGWDNDSTVERVFHHEFYHQSDPHIHDQEFNAGWAEESKLQGADFRGVTAADVFSMRREGFPSAYARSKPSEDRAEVAALLLTDPSKAEALAAKEPALKEKIDEIKKEYYDRSRGVMDETYWKLLGEGDLQKVKEYCELRELLAIQKNEK